MRTLIVYNLTTCPENMSIQQVMDITKKHGYILYNGDKENAPRVVRINRLSLWRRFKLWCIKKFKTNK